MESIKTLLAATMVLLSISAFAANPSFRDTLAAARRGDVRAEYMTGMMYAFGQGTRQDVEEGARWLSESARGGLPQAMTSLASLYDVGQGVPVDIARASALREQAARLGEATARGQLADDRKMPGQADFRRANVLTDLNMEAAAIPYARRAAAQGSVNAYLLLARAYQFGAGVPQDYGQAFKYYRQAADGGLAEGARGLAYLYEFGLGVRVDRAKALAYYDRAAAGGLSKARQAAANLRSPDYDQPRGGGSRTSGGSNNSGGGNTDNNSSQACANRNGVMHYGNCDVYNGSGYTRVDPQTGQENPQ